MKRLLLALTVLALLASVGAVVAVSQRLRRPSSAEDFTHQGAPKRLEVLWPAPAFSFRDQSGATVTREALLGKPWVANFVFTTCRTVCPLITTKMVRLQRELEGVPVRFVSFSVDPRNDTVEALAAYAHRWSPDEKRWHLLETTEPGLAALAQGFHIAAERTDAGEDPILHSTLFALVDPQGQVVGVFDLEDSEDFRGLTGAVRRLAGAAAQAEGRPERSGETLFRELSCAQCHDEPALAPPLGGLLGRKRELETSLVVTADEAYLRESILAPDTRRVRGYPLRMPSYEGHLSARELEALVKYLGTLPAPAVGTEAVPVVVDPVCQMKVRITPDALHVGETYFCSQACKDRFLQAAKP